MPVREINRDCPASKMLLKPLVCNPVRVSEIILLLTSKEGSPKEPWAGLPFESFNPISFFVIYSAMYPLNPVILTILSPLLVTFNIMTYEAKLYSELDREMS